MTEKYQQFKKIYGLMESLGEKFKQYDKVLICSTLGVFLNNDGKYVVLPLKKGSSGYQGEINKLLIKDNFIAYNVKLANGHEIILMGYSLEKI